MLLEISQNSQENTCARVSFLMKFQASGLFFTEHLWTTASKHINFLNLWKSLKMLLDLPSIYTRVETRVTDDEL